MIEQQKESLFQTTNMNAETELILIFLIIIVVLVVYLIACSVRHKRERNELKDEISRIHRENFRRLQEQGDVEEPKAQVTGEQNSLPVLTVQNNPWKWPESSIDPKRLENAKSLKVSLSGDLPNAGATVDSQFTPGKTYTVTLTSCKCDDFHKNLHGAMPCKHILALALRTNIINANGSICRTNTSITEMQKSDNALPFANQHFAFSGGMSGFTQKAAREFITCNGGHVSSSPNCKTTVVVIGKKPSQRFVLEAGSCNARFISDEDFYKEYMLAENKPVSSFVSKSNSKMYNSMDDLTDSFLEKDISKRRRNIRQNEVSDVFSELDMTISYLKIHKLEYVDKTAAGGCLYFFDQKAAAELTDMGVKLQYAHNGTTSTGNRPGWYIKSQK